jgi:hypothetical protein
VKLLRTSSFAPGSAQQPVLKLSSKLTSSFKLLLLIPALISIILADESISARFYAACLMNVRKMSYLRISFFLLQALTELNLHLFSRLVLRYLSYKVHLSCTHPCGLSLLMVVLRENRFCNLFIFITRFRGTALQTLSPVDKPLRIHRLLMLVF